MEKVECVVIGAGVVGLAIAAALARAGREVILVEGEGSVGSGVSARNSEVIHAGLYYPEGSWRSRLCREGRSLLYRWCDDRGVVAQRCGKLVVASDAAQVEALQQLERHASSQGVADLQLLDERAVMALEPELAVHAALWSPSTGIVDSHGLMMSLLAEAEAYGAALALRTAVVAVSQVAGGISLGMTTTASIPHGTFAAGFGAERAGLELDWYQARWVVNAAGLGAHALSHLIRGGALASSEPSPAPIPPAFHARGHYVRVVAGPRPRVRHLVYPLPDPAGGLGVHLTLDLQGGVRFGPDLQWIDPQALGLAHVFDIPDDRIAQFYAAIRRYWPALADGALSADYAGIRPKIHGPGQAQADFWIKGPQDHGIPGWIELLGIESPGLTSSLAIGDLVAGWMSDC